MHSIPWCQRRFSKTSDETLVTELQPNKKFLKTNNIEFLSPQHLIAESKFSKMLPRLSLKVQIRWIDEHLYIFLVTGGLMLEIGKITHEAVLLFDGKTCCDKATIHLLRCTSASQEELSNSLDDLQTLLAFHGFSEISEAAPIESIELAEHLLH